MLYCNVIKSSHCSGMSISDCLVSDSCPRDIVHLYCLTMQLKSTVQLERRRGFWRALKQLWTQRIEAGAAESIPPSLLLPPGTFATAQGRATVQAARNAKGQILDVLHLVGFEDAKWHVLPTGREVCLFTLSMSTATSSASLSELKELELAALEVLDSAGSGKVKFAASSITASRGIGTEKGAVAEGSGTTRRKRVSQSQLRWLKRQVIKGGKTPAMTKTMKHKLKRLRRAAAVAAGVGEGVGKNRAALLLLAPWEVCVNNGRPLAGVVLQRRLLRKQGFKVVEMKLEHWVGLPPAQQQEAVRKVMTAVAKRDDAVRATSQG